MKGNQLKRLQKLEKQIGDDRQDFFLCDMDEIYKQCPDILEARDELEDYVIRHGPEPPRFYQYGESEHLRRWMWTLQIDKPAQALYKRLAEMLDHEAEVRGAEREKKASDDLLKNWEWHLGAPEREAKAAAEREERKRKMEEERLERERKWQEERAAILQQTSGVPGQGGYSSNQQQPQNGYANDWWNK